MNPHAQIIGMNIKQESARRGITVNQLAEDLNIPQKTLLRWLSGERTITVYGLIRTSRILGVPLERLTKGIQ